MAKDLPYFKFYPGEWLAGNITLCSLEAQGVFINFCAYYWQANASICLTIAKARFKQNENALNELFEYDILKVDDANNVIINFLDNQMLNDFEKTLTF